MIPGRLCIRLTIMVEKSWQKIKPKQCLYQILVLSIDCITIFPMYCSKKKKKSKF